MMTMMTAMIVIGVMTMISVLIFIGTGTAINFLILESKNKVFSLISDIGILYAYAICACSKYAIACICVHIWLGKRWEANIHVMYISQSVSQLIS